MVSSILNSWSVTICVGLHWLVCTIKNELRNFVHTTMLPNTLNTNEWSWDRGWASWAHAGAIKQRKRSFSFPGSTPVCPRCVRIALTSFQGLTRVSPQCPACGVGHLGAGPRCMTSLRERWVIVRLALVRGSPEWAPRGRPREANRTHSKQERLKFRKKVFNMFTKRTKIWRFVFINKQINNVHKINSLVKEWYFRDDVVVLSLFACVFC